MDIPAESVRILTEEKIMTIDFSQLNNSAEIEEREAILAEENSKGEEKLCKACQFRLAIYDSDYCDRMKCFIGNTPEGNLNYLQRLVIIYKEG